MLVKCPTYNIKTSGRSLEKNTFQHQMLRIKVTDTVSMPLNQSPELKKLFKDIQLLNQFSLQRAITNTQHHTNNVGRMDILTNIWRKRRRGEKKVGLNQGILKIGGWFFKSQYVKKKGGAIKRVSFYSHKKPRISGKYCSGKFYF